MNEPTKLLFAILLPFVIWSIIFLIQVMIGYFLPPILIGALAAITGVIIGSLLAQK